MTDQNNAAQHGLTDGNVKLDINGATWLGMRVAGWTWEEDAFSPDQFPSENTVRHYASHWSTGPHNAERLYRESDVAALLSKLRAEGVQAGDERVFQLVQDLHAFAANQRWFGEHGYEAVGASRRLEISNELFARLSAALASAPVAGEAVAIPLRPLTEDERAAIDFYILNPTAAVRDLDKRLSGHTVPQASEASWPDDPTPAMIEALRTGSRKDWPSDELCRVRYAALRSAALSAQPGAKKTGGNDAE